MIEDIKDEDGLPKDNGIFRIDKATIGVERRHKINLRLELSNPQYSTVLVLENQFMVELLAVLDVDDDIEDICAYLRGWYVHLTVNEERFMGPVEAIGDPFELKRVRFRGLRDQ